MSFDPYRFKALQALSKEGRDVRTFPELVPTLHAFLTETWTALYTARQDASTTASHVARVQVRETTFTALLQLINAILKFNFAKVPPLAVSQVLETVCKISDPSVVPMLPPRPPRTPSPPVEATTQSTPRPDAKSPPATPGQKSGRDFPKASAASPLVSPSNIRSPPRAGDRSSVTSTPGMISLGAPMPLSTFSPVRPTLSAGPTPAPHPLKLLRVEEVKLMFLVLESTITFGFLPPEAVPPVTFFLARILGRDQLGALPDSSLDVRASGVQTRLLRAHYANPSLRALIDTLSTLPLDRTALATLDFAVGGIRFLAHAGSYIDHLTPPKQDRVRGDMQVRPRYKAATPYLDPPLVHPALHRLAQVGADEIDLELIKLYRRILPRLPAVVETAQVEEPSLNCIRPVTLTDWKLLLSVLVLTQKRVKLLRKSYVQDTNPVSSLTAQAKPSTSTAEALMAPDPVHPVVAAFVALMSSCRFSIDYFLAPDVREKRTGRTLYAIPWSMGWSQLSLDLLSAFPDHDAEQVVDFVEQYALALPCSGQWIETLNALVDGILYRGEVVSKPLGSTPAPRARHLLANLLFDSIYPSVADFPRFHSRLVVEVLIPLADKMLFDQPDKLVLPRLLETLVYSAVTAGTAEEKVVPGELDSKETEGTNFGHLDAEQLSRTNLTVFDAIRALLKRLVRDGRGVMGGAAASKMVFCLHSANEAAVPVTVHAALALIAIFNRIAFTSPWDPQNGSVDVGDSMAARGHAITILRDINEIIRGPLDPVLDSPPPPGAHRIAMEPRLVALQWALRLRTDNQHRLYLIHDLDEFIEPHAVLIGRDRSVHVTPEEPVPRVGRTSERGWEEVGRPLSGPRDESRGRDRGRREARLPREGSRARVLLDREREREREKEREKERDQARLHWHLPQRTLFEHTDDMVRSEIVRTYIPRPAAKEEDLPPHARGMQADGVAEHLSESDSIPLPVSLLLETYRLIMAQETDWDLVSYVICHLPSQLTNRYLFCGPRSEAQILALQSYLYETLPTTFAGAAVLPPGLGVKKAAVAAIGYKTLQALVGYRGFLTRSRQDEVVLTFVHGVSSVSSASSSESVNLACVRGLALCAVQLTKSFTFALPQALTALQKVVTSGTMSVHILELMITIAHSRATYRDFRASDYKLVLGIASQYISYHQSITLPPSDPSDAALRNYVVFQAYYVLALFFTRVRLSDRIGYMELVMRELLDGKETLTDQTIAVLDYLSRLTFANARSVPERSFITATLFGTEPTKDPGVAKFRKPTPGQQVALKTKTYVYPHSIVAISALERRQWCEILIRRPSGIILLLVKVENDEVDRNASSAIRLPDQIEGEITPPTLPPSSVLPPRLNGPGMYGERSGRQGRWRRRSLGGGTDDVPLSEEGELAISPNRGKEVGASPEEKAVEEQDLDRRIEGARAQLDPALIQVAMTGYPDVNEALVPVPIDTSTRLNAGVIDTLDKRPVVDSVKVGVLFLGPRQTEPKEILGNVYGSAAYANFVRHLGGKLYPLDAPEVQARGTGGLNPAEHGRHMYIWRDEITQVFWHVATMMPNLPSDPDLNNKIGPVGNDHVHIIWNESGEEYAFGTISSQFVDYMINIVISPDARGGVELGSLPRESVSKSYRVTLQRSRGLPNFSPVGDGVVISEVELPQFVRLLAINSHLMAQIYYAAKRGEEAFITNWTSRIMTIRRLHGRLAPSNRSEQPLGTLRLAQSML